MGLKYSRADHVRAHEKSVVLGGARVLFPVDPALTQAFARQIADAIKAAEMAAYTQGAEEARRAMRIALGVK